MFENSRNWAISNQVPKYLYMGKAQRLSLGRGVGTMVPKRQTICGINRRYSLLLCESKGIKDGKYTELAQHFQSIISTCEKLRADLNVFLILHSEDVVSDNAIVEYKVSTIGKLLDNQLA